MIVTFTNTVSGEPGPAHPAAGKPGPRAKTRQRPAFRAEQGPRRRSRDARAATKAGAQQQGHRAAACAQRQSSAQALPDSRDEAGAAEHTCSHPRRESWRRPRDGSHRVRMRMGGCPFDAPLRDFNSDGSIGTTRASRDRTAAPDTGNTSPPSPSAERSWRWCWPWARRPHAPRPAPRPRARTTPPRPTPSAQPTRLTPITTGSTASRCPAHACDPARHRSRPLPSPAPSPQGRQDRFSKTRYPNIRRHFLRAVRKGWAAVLVLNRPGAAARRDRLLESIPTRMGYDRDEYPPAVGRGRGRGLTRGSHPLGWKRLSRSS